MAQEKHLNQEKINEIWRKQWKQYNDVEPEKIFSHRLFFEGYSVIRKYVPDNARKILDAGGGTGRYGLQLAKELRQSTVVVSDILDESLGIGRKIAAERSINNVQFQKDDILFSSFSDNQFDVVLSDAVIQHLPDYKKAVGEFARITKPGGRIIIGMNNFWNFHTLYKLFLKLSGRRYEYGYEKSLSGSGLANVMRKAGLKIIAIDGFYVGYGLFRLKKYHRIFRFLGGAANRLSRILDKFTGRFFSKKFGFEILAVGEKVRQLR